LSDPGDVQVIAPFLIILLVASRRALTSAMIASGNVDSIHFKNQGRPVDGVETLPDGNLVSFTETNEETPGGLVVGAETSFEEAPLR
jgi:hypothetical protein